MRAPLLLEKQSLPTVAQGCGDLPLIGRASSQIRINIALILVDNTYYMRSLQSLIDKE